MTGCQRFSTRLSGQMQGWRTFSVYILLVLSRPGGKWCSVNVCTPFSLPHNRSTSHRNIARWLRRRDYIAQKECICLQFFIGIYTKIWGGTCGGEGGLSTNSHTLTVLSHLPQTHTNRPDTHTLFSHPMIFTMPSSDAPVEQNYKLHYNDVPRMRRYCGRDVPRGSYSTIKK